MVRQKTCIAPNSSGGYDKWNLKSSLSLYMYTYRSSCLAATATIPRWLVPRNFVKMAISRTGLFNCRVIVRPFQEKNAASEFVFIATIKSNDSTLIIFSSAQTCETCLKYCRSCQKRSRATIWFCASSKILIIFAHTSLMSSWDYELIG